MSSNGYEVDEDLCILAGKTRPESTRLCRATACDTPYYKYTPWRPCSERCGSEGVSLRDAQCFPAGADAVEDVSRAACVNINQEPVSRNCNRIACTLNFWEPDTWGPCTTADGQAPLCGGSRSRTVGCKCAACPALLMRPCRAPPLLWSACLDAPLFRSVSTVRLPERRSTPQGYVHVSGE